MITVDFLKKWRACYLDAKINLLMPTGSMTAAEMVARVDIPQRDKVWVLTRILIAQSHSDLVEFANHCRDEAKRSAAAYAYAAYAADAAAAYADVAAAYADVAAADAAAAYAADAAAAYAADADVAAAYAAYAADVADVADADVADVAAADAARNKSYQNNLEFGLTLLPNNGTT